MCLHRMPMTRLLMVIVSLTGFALWAVPLPAEAIKQHQVSLPREGVALGLLTQVPPISHAAPAVLAGGVCTAIPSINGVWRENVHPGFHFAHAAAYDEARGRLVVYGGIFSLGSATHTHEWDGQKWHRVTASGPPARKGHKMVYDAARQRILMFGGAEDVGFDQFFFNDTWEWDGSVWTQVANTGPAPRGIEWSCSADFLPLMKGA